MSDQDTIENRLQLLEKVGSIAFRLIEQNRHETMALKAALGSLIDEMRPDDPSRADQWLDRMLDVAIRSVALHTTLAAEKIIGDRGIDRDMLKATEDEARAVSTYLAIYFAGMKSPRSGLG